MRTEIVTACLGLTVLVGGSQCGSTPSVAKETTATATAALTSSNSGSGRFQLIGGNCLMPTTASPPSGSTLQQGSCGSALASSFTLGSSFHVLTRGAQGPIGVGGMCIDANYTTGAVQLNPCNQAETQEWTWHLGQLRPASQPSKCLTAGSPATLAACSSGSIGSQTFLPLDFNVMFVSGIQALSQFAGPHTPYQPNVIPPAVLINYQCLDVLLDKETTAGTPLDDFQCNETPAQWFHFDANSHLLTTQATCVTALSATSGSGVAVEPCNGSVAQQWGYSAPSLYTLDGAGFLPQFCVDVVGGSSVPATLTDLGTCNFGSTAGQTWDMNLVWPQVPTVTPSDLSTALFGQSETSVNVTRSASTTYITVAYNQLNGPYTPAPIGWSTWDSGGQRWVHGNASVPGWNFLSDNALASYAGAPQYVFLAALATTNSGGDSTGACVLQSTDYGKTFSPWGCVNAARADGASLAAFSSNVYYAANINSQTIGVFTNTFAPGSKTTGFTALQNPFPNETMLSQPRLRATNFGTLYVAAVAADGRLLLNSYDPIAGGWGSKVVVATGVPNYNSPIITFANGTTAGKNWAAEFSFDVGYGDQTGVSQMRVAYTQSTPDSTQPAGFRYSIAASRCFDPLDIATCVQVWSSTGPVAGDRFRPNVATSGGLLQTNTWLLTYSSREADPAGSTVAIVGGTLIEDGHFYPAQIAPPETVCAGNHTWGEYDSMAYLSTDNDGVGHFVRAFNDTSLAVASGTCGNEEFIGPHVSAVLY